MKSFGTLSTAVAAATVFASSVYGQLDPIVIKVLPLVLRVKNIP